MAFNIGLSGLEAAQQQLDTRANNIANSETTGFKRSRTQFEDLFSSGALGGASSEVGSGVQVAGLQNNFAQGALESTGRDLDLALSGQGFFTLDDGGSQVFSRAGSFSLDREGFVTNPQGQRLQVFDALDPSGNNFQTGTLSDLQLNKGVSPPEATSGISANFNFSAAAPTKGAGNIDPTNSSTFNFSNSTQIFDSLGETHQATLFARKVNDTQFDIKAQVDSQTLGQETINFDSSGQLQPGDETVSFGGDFTPSNGANAIDLDYDLTGSTLFGSDFQLNELNQDGFQSGQLSGLEVSDNGVVQARFDNGRSEALGKIAISDFNNNQGLEQLGKNGFAETFQSGAAQFGEAGAGQRGSVRSGSLEGSNVDLSDQLVGMIETQRNFQANAQVISREDQLTQTVINIGR